VAHTSFRFKQISQNKLKFSDTLLAVTGRYVLPSAIFDCLERTPAGRGGEIQLTDGLRLLAQEQGLFALIYEGRSYDAGDKLGFLKATVEIALENAELGADFRAYLRRLKP
jgi:UTP--glucose-1-phosphate uridylyltransferase